jgi:hypothetical protein
MDPCSPPPAHLTAVRRRSLQRCQGCVARRLAPLALDTAASAAILPLGGPVGGQRLTPPWPLSGPLVDRFAGPLVEPSLGLGRPLSGPLVEPAACPLVDQSVGPAASTVSLEVEFKLTSSPSPSLNSVFKDFQIYFNGVRFYTSEIFNPTSMMFDFILQRFSTLLQ